MTDISKLNEAIADASINPGQRSFAIVQIEVLEAARSYAALEPLLRELIERQNKSEDGQWAIVPCTLITQIKEILGE